MRREAVKGAILHILLEGGAAAALLWLRTRTALRWLDILFLGLAAADLLTIPFTLIALRQRMHEIKGGEFDAARKY